ncbi:718_t:CDS:2, partial [Gigaspora margarita]
DGLESKILMRWDTVTSKASLTRNGSKGPIKKYDIFGICKSEQYELELILGEISYGPFDETYKHTFEDRIKLNKGAKDSLDSIYRNYSKTSNLNLSVLKIFLIHSYVDKKFSPMFRVRRLAKIEAPFKKGSNLLQLIEVVQTFKNDNSEIEDETSETENNCNNEYYIPTFNTP